MIKEVRIRREQGWYVLERVVWQDLHDAVQIKPGYHRTKFGAWWAAWQWMN